ncbi:MAG TPA: ABC transporter substrate-binding protein [Marinobacter sp.]|nr:ABC transporter substrate-binding protein [uncultured Marinobacter sp.]HET8800459.1 ABC transporter substrate-binding protein [Marinobacter sp.]
MDRNQTQDGMTLRSRVTVEPRSAVRSCYLAARLLLFVLSMLLLAWQTPVLARDTERSVVYLAGSGNAALDQYVAKLLEQHLGPTQTLRPISGDQASLLENEPVVTIGPSAFSRVRQANRSAPILALLVEKDFLDGFSSRSSGQISGIYYDVPLLRQALTGKAILPHATQIALLATVETADLYEPLIDQLSRYDLSARLFVVEGDDQLIPTLIRALSYGDFLLAAPDSKIYNPRTIKHILLTAYRRNKIVIGPSQAYVKAGSLASSYAPFPVMADIAADYLKTYQTTGRFPAPAYPPTFRVEINEQVARSLNIPLPDRDDITEYVDTQINNPGRADDE